MTIYAFVALCLFGSALAQIPGEGPCPHIETAKDFDIAKYMGRWYEAERYESPFEAHTKCMMADYTLQENGTNVTILEASSQVSEETGVLSHSQALIFKPDGAESGKLRIKLTTMKDIETDYWVLGTDYDSFAVVFSCLNKGLKNDKYAWILTRDRHPAAEVMDKAKKVIEDSKIDGTSFLKANQKDCEQS